MTEEALTIDERLAQVCVKYRYKPKYFVRVMYPWGALDTELEHETGPDTWQDEVMALIEDYFTSDRHNHETLQIAIASGRGIGKGALTAWLVHWFLSVFKRPQIVVTANTGEQLNTKTWREVALWHNRALNGHWFHWTATKYYMKGEQSDWFASAATWSEEHTEAFQGTHAPHMLVIFDESSSIPDKIWEVTQASFTDPNSIWLVLGNPTRGTGRFRECFGKYKHRWHTFQIDARDCKRPQKNLKQLQQIVEDYGEDHDYTRVHVKGQFPRGGSLQFIDTETVENAKKRDYDMQDVLYSPVCLGVDIARFGEDQTVILVRRGLKVLNIAKYRKVDLMMVASLISEAEHKWKADVVFVDEGGLGAGVIDRGRQLGYRWIPVNGAMRASDTRKYANKRAECWDRMREWLPTGDIPDDQELINDLLGPEYGYRNERLLLEKKEDMKSRGLNSPDCGDALAVTFAEPLGARLEEDRNPFYLQQTQKTPDSATGY